MEENLKERQCQETLFADRHGRMWVLERKQIRTPITNTFKSYDDLLPMELVGLWNLALESNLSQKEFLCKYGGEKLFLSCRRAAFDAL